MVTRFRWYAAALGAAALLAAGAPTTAQAASHGHTVVVKPGTGTISAAAKKASSGDTLKLRRGKYVDAVDFGSKAISVVGAGMDRTVIVSPGNPSEPSAPCAAAALCWSKPKGAVSVSDLTTRGHMFGILGFQMNGMRVENTRGRDHVEYGVAAFQSHRLTWVHNVENGNGGVAGFYIGETNSARAIVRDNRSTGYLLGFFFRDSRRGVAMHNVATRNCVGFLLLDTGPNGPSSEPNEGGASVNYPGGNWRLTSNQIVRNTRFCPAGTDEDAPALGGIGVAVLGDDHVMIDHNVIARNSLAAGQESAIRPAGVVVMSAKQIAGADDPDHVTVTHNRLHNPLDLLWDKTGTKIRFRDNSCRTSIPDGLC